MATYSCQDCPETGSRLPGMMSHAWNYGHGLDWSDPAAITNLIVCEVCGNEYHELGGAVFHMNNEQHWLFNRESSYVHNKPMPIAWPPVAPKSSEPSLKMWPYKTPDDIDDKFSYKLDILTDSVIFTFNIPDGPSFQAILESEDAYFFADHLKNDTGRMGGGTKSRPVPTPVTGQVYNIHIFCPLCKVDVDQNHVCPQTGR